MKHTFFLILVLLTAGVLGAQVRNPSSTAQLAGEIALRYADPTEKVMAAYAWVTTNIRYSSAGAFALNNNIDRRAKIDVAFSKRAGVCENFAAIFVDLCQKMGFSAWVIEGIANENVRAANTGHSWASVQIDGSWYLFDPTWDMGKSTGFQYFKRSGDEFGTTHKPFDPLWQLRSPQRNKRNPALADTNDDLISFTGSDSMRMLESATERIRHAKTKSDLAETHLKVLQNELEIKRQEQQMEWFNHAVNLMNEAAGSLNRFIDSRNDRFQNFSSFDQLISLLSGIDSTLDSALKLLTLVDESKAVLVYGTGPARDQIDRLRKRCSEQRSFLNKYLATDISQRKTLF